MDLLTALLLEYDKHGIAQFTDVNRSLGMTSCFRSVEKGRVRCDRHLFTEMPVRGLQLRKPPLQGLLFIGRILESLGVEPSDVLVNHARHALYRPRQLHFRR